MSLVRITGEQQAAVELARQLRARKFDTEIVSAGTPSSSAADLEIALEESSVEDVLGKAMAIVSEDPDACVFLSPDIAVPAVRSDASNSARTEAPFENRVEGAAAPAPQSGSDLGCVEELPPTSFDQELEARSATYIFEALLEDDPRQPHIAQQEGTSSGEPQPISQSISDTVSDWPIWQLASEQGSSDVFLESTVPRQNAKRGTLLGSVRRLKDRAGDAIKTQVNDRRFLGIATATAALAVIGLLFAVTFHRFSPLPERLLKGSTLASQPAPFREMRATAASRDAARPVPKPPFSASAQALTPQAHPHSAAVLKTSARLVGAVSDEAGVIAKDTVIRYDARSETRHIFGEPRQSGVKYYSDLSPTR
jgi:hypothetical protein